MIALSAGRLVSMLSVAAVLLAALGASATHSSTAVPRLNGFAGPVSSAPRPIDRDLEPALRGALHRVACPAAGDAGCWVAR